MAKFYAGAFLYGFPLVSWVNCLRARKIFRLLVFVGGRKICFFTLNKALWGTKKTFGLKLSLLENDRFHEIRILS